MSTRSATIIRQTTYWGEQADTEELMRFYRHCDGYPEGHGMDMAESIVEVDVWRQADTRAWCQLFLEKFLAKPCTVEFEPYGYQHGDLEYLYVVEGIVDHRWGATHDGKLPVTISVYGIGWDEDYNVAMERTPIFSGTAYEYIQKFGGAA
jgi:hypothetical protein